MGPVVVIPVAKTHNSYLLSDLLYSDKRPFVHRTQLIHSPFLEWSV